MSAKILIIDEDRTLVKSLERTFDFCGFEVWSAPDGMIGVKAALRHRPDVIILELEFPAGGAPFVLENLQKSMVTRDIPVLIVTASTNARAKRRLLEFGIQTYLQKPCDREELLAHVIDLLGSRHGKQSFMPRDPLISSGDYQSPAPTEQTSLKKNLKVT